MGRLGLRADGPSFATHTSQLCPVVFEGRPAFLKLTDCAEELTGTRALMRWGGEGAVRVLAWDGDAIVMERGGRTLRASVDDDTATREMCAVAARLHARASGDPAGFPSLRRWFASLFADTRPEFERARAIADELLTAVAAPVLLHGDIHPENVLDAGARGWLAIDPKGIIGARQFDYCNIFTNWTLPQAIDRFDARLAIVGRLAEIDQRPLLRWIAAWSALSEVWELEAGAEEYAALPHAVMELALARL